MRQKLWRANIRKKRERAGPVLKVIFNDTLAGP